MPARGWKRRWKAWMRQRKYGAMLGRPIRARPVRAKSTPKASTRATHKPLAADLEPPAFDYQAMLKDDRWATVRLRIIQRDKSRCKSCGVIPPWLEVHHGYYQYGRPPWGYEDSSLSALCRDCHENETRWAEGQKDDLVKALASKGVLGQSYKGLARAIWRCTFHAPAAEVCAAMAWSVYDKRSQKAMLRRYRRAKTLRR